jgi:hypothetical protein
VTVSVRKSVLLHVALFTSVDQCQKYHLRIEIMGKEKGEKGV